MRYKIPEKFPDQVEKSFPEGPFDRVAFKKSRADLLFQFSVQLCDEHVLVLEIPVDRSGSHARFFGDLGHWGSKTMLCDEFHGCFHDLTALVRTFHDSTSTSVQPLGMNVHS